MTLRLKVEYRGGGLNLVAGNYPVRAAVLMLVDPWGNNLGQVLSGGKPEHGLGGFEFVAPNPAPGYDLHTNGVPGWEFEHKAGLTFLTWEEDTEPPPPPPPPPPPEGVEVDPRILGSIEIQQLDGAPYKIRKVEWLDPAEADGLHYIFVRVVDPAGNFLEGEIVRVSWAGGHEDFSTWREPSDDWGMSFPMYATLGSYDVHVLGPGMDQDASDWVLDMGLGTPSEPTVKHHTCFGLTFERVEEEPPEPPGPPEPPTPPPSPPPIDNLPDPGPEPVKYSLEWYLWVVVGRLDEVIRLLRGAG